jgi:hypothetical protein
MRSVTLCSRSRVSADGQNPRLRCARRGLRHRGCRFAHRGCRFAHRLASSQLASHDAGMLPRPSRTRHRPKRAESMLTDLLAQHSPPISRGPYRQANAIAQPPPAPASLQLAAGQNGPVGHPRAMIGLGEHDAAICFMRVGALATGQPAPAGAPVSLRQVSAAQVRVRGQFRYGECSKSIVPPAALNAGIGCRQATRRPHSIDRMTAAALTHRVLPGIR